MTRSGARLAGLFLIVLAVLLAARWIGARRASPAAHERLGGLVLAYGAPEAVIAGPVLLLEGRDRRIGTEIIVMWRGGYWQARILLPGHVESLSPRLPVFSFTRQTPVPGEPLIPLASPRWHGFGKLDAS